MSILDRAAEILRLKSNAAVQEGEVPRSAMWFHGASLRLERLDDDIKGGRAAGLDVGGKERQYAALAAEVASEQARVEKIRAAAPDPQRAHVEAARRTRRQDDDLWRECSDVSKQLLALVEAAGPAALSSPRLLPAEVVALELRFRAVGGRMMDAAPPGLGDFLSDEQVSAIVRRCSMT